MVAAWNVIKKVVDPNEREVGRLLKQADRVLTLEKSMAALSDEQLREMTARFRERLHKGETLDDVMVEAFAAAREAAYRAIGEKPYKVQVAGAVALHRGMIAEMKTGEGKTLVATMPLYLNALAGKGAHLVTTNDFLVRHQAEWMGRVYEALGMECGHVQHSMSAAERRAMYQKDITYVENSELGFDYLRDNMARHPAHLTLRDLFYAIVDEADSILIDEARTPLIISGEASSGGADYDFIQTLVAKMLRANREDEPLFLYDKKDHQASLTEAGQIWVEGQLGMKGTSLVDPENVEIAQLVDNSLKAHFLYERDHEYVVKDGEVVIVDEFTGHLQPGRRYSDGLHQAIEAKEGVYTPRIRQTVASITYQNFFRLYGKLAGMTGTAKSEEPEFVSVYGARVVVVPTNRPVARKDHADVIHKTREAKYRAIVNEIINMHVREQPVLVGTRSVDVSEQLGARLSERQLKTHALVQVLLWRLYDAKGIDKTTREQWYALLRSPIDELINQATHLKRRGRGDEVTLGDIVEQLNVPPDILDDANLDMLLRITGVIDDKTPQSEIEPYRPRLAAMLADGMNPGDGEHESMLNILNAKRHESEGRIIAQAGRPGMVTIATNMAGRGVDIALGGRDPETDEVLADQHEHVKEVGGLHVLGSERHESRRIDNQLRGRSGRQGDPGSSRFHVSLDDELMKFFGTERVQGLIASWPEEEPISHSFVSRTLENAQHKVEMRNMGIRRNTLKYDDVMNKQRTVVYEQRRRVLSGENVHDAIERMIGRTVEQALGMYAPPAQDPSVWDIEALYRTLKRIVAVPVEAESDGDVETPGGGIALKLAEFELGAMLADGDDVAAWLFDQCEQEGELSRSMDRKRAERVRREQVEDHIGTLLKTFSRPDGALDRTRLIDVARAIGRAYPRTLDELALSGLYSIDHRDLHEVLPRMALEVYSEREYALIDMRILNGALRLADDRLPRDKWNLPALESYLFCAIHDLRPRLALERLKALEVEDEPEHWLLQRTLAAYEQLQAVPQKAEQERAQLRFRIRGTLIDIQRPDEEHLRRRVEALVAEHGATAAGLQRCDLPGLVYGMYPEFPALIARLADEQLEAMAAEGRNMAEALMDFCRRPAPEGAGEIGYGDFRARERSWLMHAVDRSWMEHLLAIDDLREGIHLRAHAQRDPLIEYQREASKLFDEMMGVIARRVTQQAFSGTEELDDAGMEVRQLQATHQSVSFAPEMEVGGAVIDENRPSRTYVADKEPGRNDPCPCGSGKKYKKCCMLKK